MVTYRSQSSGSGCTCGMYPSVKYIKYNKRPTILSVSLKLRQRRTLLAHQFSLRASPHCQKSQRDTQNPASEKHYIFLLRYPAEYPTTSSIITESNTLCFGSLRILHITLTKPLSPFAKQSIEAPMPLPGFFFVPFLTTKKKPPVLPGRNRFPRDRIHSAHSAYPTAVPHSFLCVVRFPLPPSFHKPE